MRCALPAICHRVVQTGEQRLYGGPHRGRVRTAGSCRSRLASQRKLAGLTQQQLAARSHVSASLISQVERGVVPASPGFTAAVASGLEIEVEALYAQPHGAAITDLRAHQARVPALRVALDCADDPVLSGPTMTQVELRTKLDECERDRTRSRYVQMTAALPELLQHSYVLAADARAGIESEMAWSLLSDAYLLAQTVCFRFGHLDLAAQVNERWRQAADHSGDPLRGATAAYQRGALRLFRGDYHGVLRLMERAHSQIAQQRGPTANSVRAQLHLRQTIAYAREGIADRADDHITAARELVARGVPANPYFDVLATETNVDLHWVAVPVELSDGTTAVARAGRVQHPERDEPCRAGRYWIDVARAWTLYGARAQALDALNRARRLAPQLTRYHPQVHETVHLLAETDRRATDSLAGFARWIGVTL